MPFHNIMEKERKVQKCSSDVVSSLPSLDLLTKKAFLCVPDAFWTYFPNYLYVDAQAIVIEAAKLIAASLFVLDEW